MKLKNKQTGEIIDKWPDDFVVNSGSQIYNYNSLAELCDDWEDYEEPKEYWCINEWGIIEDTDYKNDKHDNAAKEIGNIHENPELIGDKE